MAKTFPFGRNWNKFLSVLSEDRIQHAQESIRKIFGDTLTGKRFLDVGCGSGLFSLAAKRLGASVSSFDYDPLSVRCAETLKETYFPADSDWTIQRGSVLDAAFMRGLGQFDAVYAWGVLHHSGAMWKAIENVCIPVGPGGMLIVALYNDQGLKSRIWKQLKRAYCANTVGRLSIVAAGVPALVAYGVYDDARRGRNPTKRYLTYRDQRGMSVVRDWADWLGGYPFEVAKPGDVQDFYKARGFVAERATTTTSLGCNEFAFRRVAL